MDDHPRSGSMESTALRSSRSQVRIAESLEAHFKDSYVASLKVQKDFLDQNLNAPEEYDRLQISADEEENGTDDWGVWSPETEKYWTLQYMDVKRALEGLPEEGDDVAEGQMSPSGDVVIVVDQNGRRSDQPSKFQGDHSDGGLPKPPNPPPPPGNNSHLRRVTFWVCSMPAQPVGAEYDDPKVRARFTAKVLMLKTAQLVAVFAAIMGMGCSKRLQEFHRKSVLPIWTATVLYVIVVMSLKINLAGLTRKGAAGCLLLQTLCLIEICFTIASASDPYVMVCILMVLCFTYLTIAACAGFLALDIINSNNLFGLTWILVFLTSIGVVWGWNQGSGNGASTLAAIIGHFWIPTLLCSETAVLLTLSELYQILQGNRIPLLNAELDWILATAQLY